MRAGGGHDRCLVLAVSTHAPRVSIRRRQRGRANARTQSSGGISRANASSRYSERSEDFMRMSGRFTVYKDHTIRTSGSGLLARFRYANPFEQNIALGKRRSQQELFPTWMRAKANADPKTLKGSLPQLHPQLLTSWPQTRTPPPQLATDGPLPRVSSRITDKDLHHTIALTT